MLAETLVAATLICLDPGHGTPAAIGAEREPIGPGSNVTKIKDPGGAPGEAEVVLAIAKKTRTLLPFGAGTSRGPGSATAGTPN
jgi:N-acetylmuramoyl-L-alanine amidase